MRLGDIVRHIRGIFEKKKKNPITYNNDNPLSETPIPVKIGGDDTPIHLANQKIKIDTDNIKFDSEK